MMHDIKIPDNEADIVINLTIAGNDLVRVTNYLSATFVNECKGYMQYDWYKALRCVNQQIVEQMATQRTEASMRKYFNPPKPDLLATIRACKEQLFDIQMRLEDMGQEVLEQLGMASHDKLQDVWAELSNCEDNLEIILGDKDEE